MARKRRECILQKLKVGQKTQVRLAYINPKEPLSKQAEAYWKEKLCGVCVVALLSAALTCAVQLGQRQDKNEEIGEIYRPNVGEKTQNTVLYAGDREEETWSKISFPVSERRPSKEEAYAVFVRSAEILREGILGENEDFHAVTKPLKFPKYLEETNCKISWYSSDNTRIGLDGTVVSKGQEEPRDVIVTAQLEYGEYIENLEFYMTVLQEEEASSLFSDRIREALIQAEQEMKEEGMVHLPETVGGKAVRYRQEEPMSVSVMLPVGIIAALGMFFLKDQRIQEEVKRKEEVLHMSYAEIVMKLTLLIHAGMTIRGAWERILEEYRKQGKRHYAYEEMELAEYQLKQGVSERQVYREFGKRCRIHSYRKLSSLLEQNLTKGSKGLSALLEEEVRQAFEERKNYALRKGEEAAAKLLLPMFMMLLIVLIICIAPALMAFGGI